MPSTDDTRRGSRAPAQNVLQRSTQNCPSIIYVDNRVTILCVIVPKITRNTLKMAAIFFNCLQNDGYNGMMYSAILFLKSTLHKTYRRVYLESTLKGLRLLVSEINVLLWKWPPSFLNDLKMADTMTWCIRHYFFYNLRPRKKNILSKMKVLRLFRDIVTRRPFFKMAATAPTGKIWLDTIANLLVLVYCTSVPSFMLLPHNA